VQEPGWWVDEVHYAKDASVSTASFSVALSALSILQLIICRNTCSQAKSPRRSIVRAAGALPVIFSVITPAGMRSSWLE
jgi:hypothetical protein